MMLSSSNIMEIILNGVLSVMGLMANTFILTVNFMTWMNRANEFKASNVIISSLAVANFCLQSVLFSGCILYVFWREIFVLPFVYKSYITLEMLLADSSLWFAAWLCLYCCMKIVNLTHPLYVWMNARFPKIVPWLLMGSVMVSLASSMPVALDIHFGLTANQPCNVSSEASSNISGDAFTGNLLLLRESDDGFPGDHLLLRESDDGFPGDHLLLRGCTTSCIVQVVAVSLPFTLLSFSAGTKIAFLYRHMRRMAQNAGSSSGPDPNAHLDALKAVSAFLTLYILYYLATCLRLFQVYTVESFGFIMCELVRYAFPTLSSTILIFINKSLKSNLANVFCHASCCEGEARERSPNPGILLHHNPTPVASDSVDACILPHHNPTPVVPKSVDAGILPQHNPTTLVSEIVDAGILPHHNHTPVVSESADCIRTWGSEALYPFKIIE
ncbi:taste receptor type 2 member 1-like [Ambystoma mexicanum]|uniref:taste receptor type 2 member 1-like n=1 Tax=Ambystoma mexicanum TaxID=8296 RepID=UPI0037E829BF